MEGAKWLIGSSLLSMRLTGPKMPMQLNLWLAQSSSWTQRRILSSKLTQRYRSLTLESKACKVHRSNLVRYSWQSKERSKTSMHCYLTSKGRESLNQLNNTAIRTNRSKTKRSRKLEISSHEILQPVSLALSINYHIQVRDIHQIDIPRLLLLVSVKRLIKVIPNFEISH